jgi:hypothetical protein
MVIVSHLFIVFRKYSIKCVQVLYKNKNLTFQNSGALFIRGRVKLSQNIVEVMHGLVTYDNALINCVYFFSRVVYYVEGLPVCRIEGQRVLLADE